MKMSDIEVGQEYACGTKGRWTTYRRAHALELGRHRVLDDEESKPVPAARVKFDDGTIQWVVLRSVVMPWSEYEAAVSNVDRALYDQIVNGPTRSERARFVVKELGEVGFDTGTPPFELVNESSSIGGFVRVKVEFLEDVLDALT
jgi:hypothetical protein